MQLTIIQFELSTADDEKNYFNGQTVRQHEPAPAQALSGGVYRVMDNKLYRVVGGSPINAPALPTTGHAD
jgi:hypothetical protein